VRLLGALLVALALAVGPARASDVWAFDRDHTQIIFEWDHLGLSRQTGRILNFDGRLIFSPTDPEGGSVEATLRVSSLSTGRRDLDDHLKSPDFFDAGRFPEITFRSSGVTRTGEKSGTLAGEITIRDITRPIALEVRWNLTAEHPLAAIFPIYRGKWVSGFSATGKLNRSEFGIRRAIPLVPDEIGIRIEAEFIRKD
jgi:polyisoprenoid-binding protein YceI